MIQRTALFAASLVAALVLVVGLALAGVTPGATPAVPVAAETAATSTADPPQPTVQVDTVYLTANAEPEVVTVTRHTTAASHGDDGENEGEDD